MASDSEADEEVFYDAEEDVVTSPSASVAAAPAVPQTDPAPASAVNGADHDVTPAAPPADAVPGATAPAEPDAEAVPVPEPAEPAAEDPARASAVSSTSSSSSSGRSTPPPVACAGAPSSGDGTAADPAVLSADTPHLAQSAEPSLEPVAVPVLHVPSSPASPRSSEADGGASRDSDGSESEPSTPLAQALQGLADGTEHGRIAYTEIGEAATRDANERQLPLRRSQSSSEPVLVVKNLDTGEQFGLDELDSRVPQGMDPLALHLEQLSKGGLGTPDKPGGSSTGAGSRPATAALAGSARRTSLGVPSRPGHQRSVSEGGARKTTWLPWSRHSSTEGLHKLAEGDGAGSDDGGSGEASPSPGSPEDPASIAQAQDSRTARVHAHKKNQKDFNRLLHVQTLSDHVGAVYAMKFSENGMYLATAGQDFHVRVWEVNVNAVPSLRKHATGTSKSGSGKSAGNGEAAAAAATSTATTTKIAPAAEATATATTTTTTTATTTTTTTTASPAPASAAPGSDPDAVLSDTPLHVYAGHFAFVLDLAWSRQEFLLSASMDKTVRLWHVTRQDCLFAFKHVEVVTAVAWHPTDKKVFLTASLDRKIRVWNVLEKRVMHWADTGDPVTAACFSMDGRLVLAGSYHGKCTLYSKDGLEYVTTIEVRSRRGKNAKAKKITGMQMSPDGDKVLITSSDSRVRLYSMRDYSEVCKYKGLVNDGSLIRASFSSDGRYIISGSQDNRVLIWDTVNTYIPPINPAFLLRYRRDRSESYEAFAAHSRHVTCALFAPFRLPRLPCDAPGMPGEDTSAPAPPPRSVTGSASTPSLLFGSRSKSSATLSPRAGKPGADQQSGEGNLAEGLVIVSSDYEGVIKVHVNRSWQPTPL